MPLSPEQEWTIAACGLVAHADGIMQADEWHRVLLMLGERLGDDDASAWTSLLRDHERLRAHIETLAPPMPFFREAILEKAWRMALTDGEGSAREAAVHDELARRWEMDLAEVARLRGHWSAQAHARSEVIAGFAALLANLDGRLESAEISALDALVARLPTPPGRRPSLIAMRDDPPALDDVVSELMSMDPEERRISLFELMPLVRASDPGDDERALLVGIAKRLGLSPADVRGWLER